MPITDYQIQYDQSTDVWQVLEDSVNNKYYETTMGLIAGNTYKFRVLARNSVGLSDPTEISVLVAQIPDTPVAPVTVFDSPDVIITWVAPYDGATPITSF